ncbi:MAG: hypothetical protein CBB97_16375 [Candidatus Endolissoclinum sp. TMED37]|nr:MAG: hypothetical protein CBB97_16375 [Candidatus Endolissoclinum sp. TMED37]|tara:strand:- start:584 stop:922 length:339 start_codon:yes stop_codon:yes gene_type:complete
MIIKNLNKALDNGLSKAVFDHIRNYFICAFLLALGTSEFREHSTTFSGVAPSQYHGLVAIVLSVMLILLNLYDGIRKLSKVKYHLIFIVSLIGIYLFISFRVIEMAWEFRAV